MRKQEPKKSELRGFTVVELLVVIVVIGILATIVGISYSGMTRNAQITALKSDLSSSASQLELEAWNNDLYPGSLEEVDLPTSEGTEYEYRYDSTSHGYCLTGVNKGNESWYVGSDHPSPRKGACAGHGLDGVAAITNLIANTSIEVGTDYLQNIGNSTGRSLQRLLSANAFEGEYVFRIAAGASGAVAGYGSTTPQAVPVGRYTASIWVRSNTSALNVNIYLEGSASRVNISQTGGGSFTPGVWKRLTRVFDVTSAGTVKVGFLTGSAQPGDYVEMDAIMLTSGEEAYEFSDGNSPSWIWNGTPNNSTSTGPAL